MFWVCMVVFVMCLWVSADEEFQRDCAILMGIPIMGAVVSGVSIGLQLFVWIRD